MATATIERVPYVPGNDWRAIVKWVGDNSYAAEGEALKLTECGFGPEAVFSHANILSVRNLTEQATFIPNSAYFDGTKIHLDDAATGKELAGTKDVSKVTVLLEVVCTAN